MIKGFNIKRFPMFVSLFLASVSCGQKKDVAIKVEKEPDSSVSDHIPNTVLFNRVPDTCLKPWLRPDKCSFYRECLEASITCENTPFPYAMSYGDKYCNKFQGITLTTRGEGWKRGATLCLQEANRLTGSSGQTHDGQGNVHGTCSEARQLNFEAHVSC